MYLFLGFCYLSSVSLIEQIGMHSTLFNFGGRVGIQLALCFLKYLLELTRKVIWT